MSAVSAALVYETETLQVPANLQAEVERLSRSGEAEAQAELNKLLDRYGRVLSRERTTNLITDIGARFLLNMLYLGSAYTAAWYVGLKSTGAPATADTMSSHAAWTELTGYSQTTRPVLTMATATVGRSINNSAARAVFTANTALSVAGFFVVNNSARGGTTGTLYSVTNLGTPRSITSGQTERLTISGTVP